MDREKRRERFERGKIRLNGMAHGRKVGGEIVIWHDLVGFVKINGFK